MAYLTESEITTYCSVPTVTMSNVELATMIIDSYKNASFNIATYTEKAKLRKKNSCGFPILTGKVSHFPRVNILGVSSEIVTPFGIQVVNYPTTSLLFDEDNSMYFTFMPQQQPNGFTPFAYPNATYLRVKYTAGYDVVPTEIKRVCGILADSIAKNGGFNNYKSRTDFDMTIVFSSEGILTKEIKYLIDNVWLS